MKVRVLFFGAAADLVGRRELAVEPAVSGTAADVFRSILVEFPQLQNQKLLYSVNQEFATGLENVQDGDELAVFTPVSGG